MTQRRPPFRSRALLDAARDSVCVHCGAMTTVVAAHYTGVRRGSYGGGMSIKVHDFLCAHLCQTCHEIMDTLSRDKELRFDHSERFLHAIALTLESLFARGVLRVAHQSEAEVMRL